MPLFTGHRSHLLCPSGTQVQSLLCPQLHSVLKHLLRNWLKHSHINAGEWIGVLRILFPWSLQEWCVMWWLQSILSAALSHWWMRTTGEEIVRAHYRPVRLHGPLHAHTCIEELFVWFHHEPLNVWQISVKSFFGDACQGRVWFTGSVEFTLNSFPKIKSVFLMS